MLFQVLVIDDLRHGTDEWDLAQARFSTNAQMLKSRGLRSGELGGQMCLGQKFVRLLFSQFWVMLAVCGVAPSC